LAAQGAAGASNPGNDSNAALVAMGIVIVLLVLLGVGMFTRMRSMQHGDDAAPRGVESFANPMYDNAGVGGALAFLPQPPADVDRALRQSAATTGYETVQPSVASTATPSSGYLDVSSASAVLTADKDKSAVQGYTGIRSLHDAPFARNAIFTMATSDDYDDTDVYDDDGLEATL